MNSRRILIVVGTVTAVGLGLAGWSSLGVAASTPSSGATVSFSADQIPGLAQSIAARHGDPAPGLIQHSIETTRGAANLVASGDTISGADAQTPSYLIAIRGHFSGPRPLPPLAPASAESTETYSVITLVVNAETGEITDSGHSDTYPDLAALGAVATDAPGR
jgi:hypothetical protein